MSIIPITVFCEKHGVSRDAVNSCYNNNRAPLNTRTKSGKHVYIDEKYFISRREFRNEVLMKNQSMYYFLKMQYIDMELARAMVRMFPDSNRSSWTTFLSNRLFARIDEDYITNYQVDSMHWMFFRGARWFILAIARENRRKLKHRLHKEVEKAIYG